MKKHTMSLYGNTAIERAYCDDCHSMSFVRHGELVCCGNPVDSAPKTFRRETEPSQARKLPPKGERDRILSEQGYRCIYCGVGFYTHRLRHTKIILIKLHWDHLLPYKYSQDNSTENFVAACHVCNGIKSDHVFQTLDETKVYLARVREKKGYDF